MKLNAFLSFFLVCSISVFLFGKPSPQIQKAATPNWLLHSTIPAQKVDLDEISQGYYFESLVTQYHLGLQTTYYKTVKVISDDSGIEYAGQIQVNFDPSYQQLVLHELRIERNGQSLERLNVSQFQVLATESDLNRFIYNGTYAAHLVLDDVRKGDKVILAYSIVGFNPVFEGKFADRYFMTTGEPCGKDQVVYIVPEGRTLQIKRFNGANAEKREQKGNLTYLSWDYYPKITAEYVDYGPYWYDKDERIEVSEFKSWLEVSVWGSRVNPILPIKSGSALAVFVDELWTKAKGNKKKFVEYGLDFVQDEVRYMGIEMGVNSHRAHAPEKIFSQRYGDCKDKAVLLATILQSKGIESRLVLVNSHQDHELNTRLPSPYAFNHMVLQVNVDGNNKFVDPTISLQGGSILDRYFPYYGEVLILNGGDKLEETPWTAGNEILVEDVVEMLGGNKVNFKVKTIYRSGQADQARAEFKEKAKNQIQKNYEDYYKDIYKQVKRLEPVRFEDDRAKNVFTVYESYAMDEYIYTDEEDGQLLIPAYASLIYNKLPRMEGEANGPIAVPFPLKVIYTIKIINKDKVALDNFSDDYASRNNYYHFTFNSKSRLDTLVSTSSMEFFQSYVPLEEMENYSKDYKDFVNYLNYSYYLNKDGYLSISNGNSFSMNYWALLTYALLVAFYSYIIRKWYIVRRPTNMIDQRYLKTYDSLGGWVLFLAISLIFQIVITFPFLFGEFSPLNHGFWSNLSWSKPSDIPVLLNNGLVMVVSPFLIVSQVYLVMLCFQRRDIFPESYIKVRIINIIFSFLQLFIGFTLSKGGTVNSSYLFGISILLISSIFWCLYVYTSMRVKGTFRVPYEKENQPVDQPFPLAEKPMNEGSENI